MAKNIISTEIDNIKNANVNQDTMLAHIIPKIDSHHYWCYGFYDITTENVLLKGTIIPFNNIKGFCWDPEKCAYIVPEDGLYHIEFSCFSNQVNNISKSQLRLAFFNNNKMIAVTNNIGGGLCLSTTIVCNKNDEITIGTYNNFSIEFWGGDAHNNFSIYQICPF